MKKLIVIAMTMVSQLAFATQTERIQADFEVRYYQNNMPTIIEEGQPLRNRNVYYVVATVEFCREVTADMLELVVEETAHMNHLSLVAEPVADCRALPRKQKLQFALPKDINVALPFEYTKRAPLLFEGIVH